MLDKQAQGARGAQRGTLRETPGVVFDLRKLVCIAFLKDSVEQPDRQVSDIPCFPPHARCELALPAEVHSSTDNHARPAAVQMCWSCWRTQVRLVLDQSVNAQTLQ